MQTDYEYGDSPLPIGTVVEHQHRPHEQGYKIVDHADPADHPDLRFAQYKNPDAADELEVEFIKIYPDGVAYSIWPVGVAYKRGLRHLEIRSVRRTSLRVITKGNGPC